MITIKEAAQRLEKTDHGQMACKQLLEFLESDTVQRMDGREREAIEMLVALFMCGSSITPGMVTRELRQIVQRNKFLELAS